MTRHSRVNKTIDFVVKSGLCTGCGTCVGVCPQFAIQMVKDSRQNLYFPQLDKAKCNECSICIEACPGHAVDFNHLNYAIFGKQPEDILMGNYLNCYTGYATNHDIRYHSASGGLVTTLLISALEQGIINGALVTRMNENNPLEPEPYIAANREEIIAAAKSKYCPVPANIAVRKILEKDRKYAVVGLPCHIHGIRKAETVNQELRKRIVLHIGIFCSHADSFLMTEFVLNKYKVNKKDLVHLDYRGEGWPGAMTIQLKNGTKKLIPLDDYIVYHQFGYFNPSRCSLCCDQFAELADISLGDAWLPEIVARDNVGTSAVITRTLAGKALCEQAVAKGYVALEIMSVKRASQWAVPKKRHMKSNSHLTKLFGNPVPNYGTKLPHPQFADYLWSLLIYFNAGVLSQPYLRRFIDFQTSFELWLKKWISRIFIRAS